MTAFAIFCLFVLALGLVALMGAQDAVERANRNADHWKQQWKDERHAHNETKASIPGERTNWFYKGLARGVAATDDTPQRALRLVPLESTPMHDDLAVEGLTRALDAHDRGEVDLSEWGER